MFLIINANAVKVQAGRRGRASPWQGGGGNVLQVTAGDACGLHVRAPSSLKQHRRPLLLKPVSTNKEGSDLSFSCPRRS